MPLSFVPVKSRADQKLLAEIAGEIWRGYWPDIIGEAQTEYMIEKFQSYKAIKKFMAKGNYEYWFLVATESDEDGLEKSIVGFTGGRSTPGEDEFFISKLYLFPEARGRGYARRTVEFFEDLCFVRGHHTLRLTVDKRNELGIRAYTGIGFETVGETAADIGHGFSLNDYVMELAL